MQHRVENGAIRIGSMLWGIDPRKMHDHVGLSRHLGQSIPLSFNVENDGPHLTARCDAHPVDRDDARDMRRLAQGSHHS